MFEQKKKKKKQDAELQVLVMVDQIHVNSPLMTTKKS